jgi:hypothetical protein
VKSVPQLRKDLPELRKRLGNGGGTCFRHRLVLLEQESMRDGL